MRSSIQPLTEYTLAYRDFRGGLNLRDAECDMKTSESPDMKNLLWRNGLLASRKGQKYLSSVASLGSGKTVSSSLWHGHLFAHIGTRLFAFDVTSGDPDILGTYTQLCTGVSSVRGAFFMYGGNLYYKTTGTYKKITAALVSGEWTFTAADVNPYVPVIVINASPADGAGDLYQPENRLSPRKTVWFNAASGVREFFLPVIPDSIVRVEVDGTVMTSGWSFVPAHGSVLFDNAPPVTNPPTNNTVRITYSKTNQDAYDSVDSCHYAEVYGGTGELCVVLGGCRAQPNAYFWSGNSNVAMDPGYFPMEQYQIAGETNDPITGFGKQQSNLIVFQEHQIGKATLGVAETGANGAGLSGAGSGSGAGGNGLPGSGGTGNGNGTVGRLSIDMPYTPINAKIGCLYPWSIQLIENNLVWAGAQGIYLLTDTSEANENYVKCISGKINGTPPGASAIMKRKALLWNLSRAGNAEPGSEANRNAVCSCDDEHRYYITCNGVTYAWDYEISGAKDPAWFLLSGTNFIAAAYCENEMYFLHSTGKVIGLQETFEDFGSGFERYYRTPLTCFDSRDRLKNINSVILTLSAETETDTELKYFTDYGEYTDPTNLQVVPANVYEANRTPGTRPENSNRPAVFRRRPMCRRVIHFSMQLRNNHRGEDLAIESAEVFFEKLGRLR